MLLAGNAPCELATASTLGDQKKISTKVRAGQNFKDDGREAGGSVSFTNGERRYLPRYRGRGPGQAREIFGLGYRVQALRVWGLGKKGQRARSPVACCCLNLNIGIFYGRSGGGD